jgi:hypothetical protein
MKKSLNLFYITCELLKSDLITYTNSGYKIKDSNIYLHDDQDRLMFSKNEIERITHLFTYTRKKTYTLEQIIDELPLEFKTAIIFHMDLA